MAPLPFNLPLVEFLADHRNPFLTQLFLAASFLGSSTGYILIATLIYVAWDKKLAVRLSALMLLTSSLNGILKLVIRNPRPFVRQGTWLAKWAVSPQSAASLAAEYSTPSGHAMASSSFYTYLCASIKTRAVRVAGVLAILLIGISRPYLGVHFAEDVLLGWACGLALALVFFRYTPALNAAWSRMTYLRQIGAAVAGCFAMWLLTVALNGLRADGQPRAFLAEAGFLTGIVIARPLELRMVNFDPRSSSAVNKALRYILSLALVIATLSLFGMLTSAVGAISPQLGYVSEYVRYTAAGVVSIFLAPLLFTRIGLAGRAPAPQ